MRPGIEVPGGAIDRVFHPPVLPARRLRRAIDAVLTLALGPICAFALTLGPAPLNTFTASSAEATTFGEPFQPSPEVQLLPAEVNIDNDNNNNPVQNQQELRRSTPSPSPSSSGTAKRHPADPAAGRPTTMPEAAEPRNGTQPGLPLPGQAVRPVMPSTPALPDVVLPSRAPAVVDIPR